MLLPPAWTRPRTYTLTLDGIQMFARPCLTSLRCRYDKCTEVEEKRRRIKAEMLQAQMDTNTFIQCNDKIIVMSTIRSGIWRKSAMKKKTINKLIKYVVLASISHQWLKCGRPKMGRRRMQRNDYDFFFLLFAYFRSFRHSTLKWMNARDVFAPSPASMKYSPCIWIACTVGWHVQIPFVDSFAVNMHQKHVTLHHFMIKKKKNTENESHWLLSLTLFLINSMQARH